MFYVVETRYVGPNLLDESHIDIHKIEICSSPAITNSSREIRIEGWCGTTNDFSVYAHGEYNSTEEAHVAIIEKFGDVRNTTPSGETFEPNSNNVVEVYKPGKYAPMTAEAAARFIHDSMQDDIKTSTSDEQVASIAEEYEAEANEQGYTLGRFAKGLLLRYRHELKCELKAAP